MTAEEWGALGAVLQGFAAVIGIPIIIFQLRRATQSLTFSVWDKVDSDLSSQKQRDARKYIYSGDLPSPEEAEHEDWEKIAVVANAFDRVGFLIDHKLISKTIVFDRYASIIKRTWSHLGKYVRYNRTERAKSDRSWRYFESAARQAFNYLKTEFPEHTVHTYNEETPNN